ncbi:hypothetical protein N8134_01550 [Flavobacteriales bacterium]|nr:hypothetical protein [Flavobacteriales bacterium]
MQAKLLTLCMALCAVCLTATSQNVPDYVPTEGLVAWYPFNGNANDESGNGNDFTAGQYTFVEDQFNTNSSAIAFDQLNSEAETTISNSFATSEEGTYSFWWRVEGAYSYNGYNLLTFPGASGTLEGNFLAFTLDENWYWLGCENSSSGFTATARIGNDFHVRALDCATYPEMSSWNHTVVTCTANSLKLYFNGEFIGEETVTIDFGESPNGTLSLGAHNNPAQSSLTVRIMDDLGLWNRALIEEEVLGLYNTELPVSGCTDPAACNFNAEANMEDDSCLYPLFGTDCETGAAACGEGTEWDVTVQACVVSDFCQEDLDGDGAIGVTDLMQLLSLFGTDCEAEDVDPELGEFTCGDPMNYHGYDYATVQIGEQCWFAENLRNVYYANGDAIPGALSDSLWNITSQGAQAIYMSDSTMLASYGRLYNWYAVDDLRGVCANGWRVPTDIEYTVLTDFLGGQNIAGNALKSAPTDTPSWNGTNESGFSALAAGYRFPHGPFAQAGVHTDIWTSTLNNSSLSWSRIIWGHQSAVSREAFNKHFGFAVRCLKDTE